MAVTVVPPSTEQFIGSVPEAGEADIDRAAFDDPVPAENLIRSTLIAMPPTP